MSEKRLSERMSDTTHAVNEAQDALQVAITRAVDTHFDFGIEFERERIIKLLEEHMPNSSDHDFVGCECQYPTNTWYNKHLIALIKGEQND